MYYATPAAGSEEATPRDVKAVSIRAAIATFSATSRRIHILSMLTVFKRKEERNGQMKMANK